MRSMTCSSCQRAEMSPGKYKVGVCIGQYAVVKHGSCKLQKINRLRNQGGRNLFQIGSFCEGWPGRYLEECNRSRPALSRWSVFYKDAKEKYSTPAQVIGADMK